MAADGMVSIQYVAAAALALLVFVAMANLVVDLYARGAVRAAVDEGVRTGGRLAAGPAACERRAQEVLDGLLGPRLRAAVSVHCEADGDTVRAHGKARLAAWVPGLVPDWSFTVDGRAHAEDQP